MIHKDSLYVTARFIFKPEHQAEIDPKIRELAHTSKYDEGCIQYTLHQSIEDPNTYLIYEIWESPHALQLHADSPHVKEWEALIKDKLVDFELLKLEKDHNPDTD